MIKTLLKKNKKWQILIKKRDLYCLLNKTLDHLIPLRKKFQALSFRVPTSIVSTADISVKLKNQANKDSIIEIFKQKERNQKLNIFKNNFDPLISTDFIKSEYSAIIDHRWTTINDSNYLKLVLWYDNEWGYSSRVVDTVNLLSKYI